MPRRSSTPTLDSLLDDIYKRRGIGAATDAADDRLAKAFEGKAKAMAGATGDLTPEARLQKSQADLNEKAAAIIGSDAPGGAKGTAADLATNTGKKDDEGVLGKALGVLAKPLSAVTSVAKEVDDLGAQVIGEGKLDLIQMAFGGPLTWLQLSRDGAVIGTRKDGSTDRKDPGFSLSELKENFDSNYGYGRLLEDEGRTSDNEWANRAAGLAGDIALDPFTYIGGEAALGKLGKQGVAEIAFKVGENEIGQKALKGLSTLSTEELARLSEKGVAAGHLDKPLRGGIYFGTGEAQTRIAGRGPLTSGVAAKIRGGEELVRGSKAGEYVRGFLGGDEVKAALTDIARRGTPDEAADAFNTIRPFQRGQLAERKGLAELQAASGPELAELQKLATSEQLAHIAEGTDPMRLIPGITPEQAADLSARTRALADGHADYINEMARTLGEREIDDVILKRDDYSFNNLTDEAREAFGKNADGPSPSAFDEAAIERRANIRAGETWSPTGSEDDAILLVPASEHPEGWGPRRQAQAHADEVLGESSVKLFTDDFVGAVGKWEHNASKRLRATVMESQMKNRGVATDKWATVLEPTEASTSLGKLRREISTRRMQRAFEQGVQKHTAVKAVQAQLGLDDAVIEQAGKRSAVAETGAEVAARRAEIGTPVPAAVQERSYAAAFAENAEAASRARQVVEAGLDDSSVAMDAVRAKAATDLDAHTANMSELTNRLKSLREAHDEALAEVVRAEQATLDRVDNAVQRRPAAEHAAAAEERLEREVSRSAPGQKAAEQRLAAIEAELVEAREAVTVGGMSYDELTDALYQIDDIVRAEKAQFDNAMNLTQERFLLAENEGHEVLALEERAKLIASHERSMDMAAKQKRNAIETRRAIREGLHDPADLAAEAEAVRTKLNGIVSRKNVRIMDKRAELAKYQDELATLGYDAEADEIAAMLERMPSSESGYLRHESFGDDTDGPMGANPLDWFHGVGRDVRRDLTAGVDDATKQLTTEANNSLGMHWFPTEGQAQDWSRTMGVPDDAPIDAWSAFDPKQASAHLRAENPVVYSGPADETWPLWKNRGLSELDGDMFKAAIDDGSVSLDDLASHQWDEPAAADAWAEVSEFIDDLPDGVWGSDETPDLVTLIGETFDSHGFRLEPFDDARSRLVGPEALSQFDPAVVEASQWVARDDLPDTLQRAYDLAVVDSVVNKHGALGRPPESIDGDTLAEAFWNAHPENDSILVDYLDADKPMNAIVRDSDVVQITDQNTGFLDVKMRADELKREMRHNALISHRERVDGYGFEIDRQTGSIDDAKRTFAQNRRETSRTLDDMARAHADGDAQRVDLLRQELDQRMEATQRLEAADQLQQEAAVARRDAVGEAIDARIVAKDDAVLADANVAAAQAESLRLDAQFKAGEADLAKSGAEVLSMEEGAAKLAALPQTEERVLNVLTEGAAPANWASLSNDTLAPDHIVDVLAEMGKFQTKGEVRGLLKGFDYATSLFKTYAILTPGFNFRNSFGAFFNNALAGVETGSYKTYLKATSAYRTGFTAGGHETGVAAVRAKLGNDIADAFGELRQSGLLGTASMQDESAAIGAKKFGLLDNPGTRLGYKFTGKVEDTFRGTLALDTLLKKQGTLDDAIERVMQYHFDYDDLSKFERGTMKRIVPFYTWTRKNLPLQLESILTKPKVYSRVGIFQRNLELGTREDPIVPKWFGENLGIRTPFDAQGGAVYLMPDLPIKDLNLLNNPRQALSAVNPLIKLPIEMTTGKQLYNDRPFQEGQVAMPGAFEAMGLGVAMEAVGLASRDKDGNLVTSDKSLYALEQLMPALGRSRRLLPSESKYQDRWATTAVSFAFGLGLRTNTADEQRYEIRRREAELDSLATNLRSKGYGGYYEWEQPRMMATADTSYSDIEKDRKEMRDALVSKLMDSSTR